MKKFVLSIQWNEIVRSGSISLLCISLFYSLSAQGQAKKEQLEETLQALSHPSSVADFTSIDHFPSLCQDSTLICWSFATTSFIESEMKRQGKEPVRLSVLFPVYYGFLEKAKQFVRSKGTSRFSAGDLFSGALDIMRDFGTVPAVAYEGEKTAHTIYNHNALYTELDSLIGELRTSRIWNEQTALQKASTILQKQLGAPPERFIYNKKEFTPNSFFAEIVALPLDEYISVTSFQYTPFHQYIELSVPDNWNHKANYWNIPLNIFYQSLKKAVQKGYSVAIDMDNSEPSYRMTKEYAFVPEYVLQRNSISQNEREKEFSSGATTDDHLMHIISYKKFGTEDWFLAKDSWRTAWEGSTRGYFFLHESYIKLKVLAYLVHKDAIPEILNLLPQQ